MPFLLYAVSLVVCGAAMSVLFFQGGEEPDIMAWPSLTAFTNGMVVLIFNVVGFVGLTVVQWRRTRSRLHIFLVGGLSGVISGSATSWLIREPSSLPLLILILTQAPLVVVIINWLLGRFIRLRHAESRGQ